MDIMELGAIGNLIGGVAVIGSLIYVGLQVRQSNKLNQAESIRSFARDYNTFLLQMRDPEFAAVFRKGAADFDSLSGPEQLQVHSVLFSHLMLGWADSTIDPKRSTEFGRFLDTAFASTVRSPGCGQWWSHFKEVFRQLSPSYYERIERADPPRMQDAIPWAFADESEMKKG